MYTIIKRLGDLFFSLIVTVTLSPLFIIISILIIIDSRGGVFYKQVRVGKNGKEFNLYKFRSMKSSNVKGSQFTIGNDTRITKMGQFIRKYKIDEFPQIINIFKGEMSVVGPRPEVPKYVKLYTQKQLKVLSVKPGLTDYASVTFFDEQRILGEAENPELKYIEEILPAKLQLNEDYIRDKSLKNRHCSDNQNIMPYP